MPTFAAVIEKRLRTAGAIAQLVEQRTENPCVPGSIPGGTTLEIRELLKWVALFSFLGEEVRDGLLGSLLLLAMAISIFLFIFAIL